MGWYPEKVNGETHTDVNKTQWVLILEGRFWHICKMGHLEMIKLTKCISLKDIGEMIKAESCRSCEYWIMNCSLFRSWLLNSLNILSTFSAFTYRYDTIQWLQRSCNNIEICSINIFSHLQSVFCCSENIMEHQYLADCNTSESILKAMVKWN